MVRATAHNEMTVTQIRPAGGGNCERGSRSRSSTIETGCSRDSKPESCRSPTRQLSTWPCAGKIRAAEIAVDYDNRYMREVSKIGPGPAGAIELIEVARDEARSIAQSGQRRPEQAPTRGSGRAPQSRCWWFARSPRCWTEPVRRLSDDHVDAELRDPVDERQASQPEEQRQRRPDERVAERRPAD